MKSTKTKVLAPVAACVALSMPLVALSGCDDGYGSSEDVGEDVNEGFEETDEAFDDAAEEVDDGIDEIDDEVGDGP